MPWGRGAILPRSSWVYSDRQLLQKQRLANAWFKHCILHYKNHINTATVRCTRQAGFNSRHPESSKEASKKGASIIFRCKPQHARAC